MSTPITHGAVHSGRADRWSPALRRQTPSHTLDMDMTAAIFTWLIIWPSGFCWDWALCVFFDFFLSGLRRDNFWVRGSFLHCYNKDYLFQHFINALGLGARAQGRGRYRLRLIIFLHGQFMYSGRWGVESQVRLYLSLVNVCLHWFLWAGRHLMMSPYRLLLEPSSQQSCLLLDWVHRSAHRFGGFSLRKKVVRSSKNGHWGRSPGIWSPITSSHHRLSHDRGESQDQKHISKNQYA